MIKFDLKMVGDEVIASIPEQTYSITKECVDDLRDELGRTPMHKAVVNGDIGIAIALANMGATRETEDYDGNSLLEFMVDKSFPMIEQLIEQCFLSDD